MEELLDKCKIFRLRHWGLFLEIWQMSTIQKYEKYSKLTENLTTRPLKNILENSRMNLY